MTGVTIPNSVKYLSGFSENQISTIAIPSSVTHLSDSAFYGNQLTSIEIPNSVMTIGNWALFDNELTSIEIPNSVTTIGQGVLSGNQFATFTLPSNYEGEVYTWNDRQIQAGQEVSVNGSYSLDLPQPYTLTIDDVVFEDGVITAYLNTNEKDIIIPDNFNGETVIEIGGYAFYGNSLTQVNIANTVKSIGEKAFSGNSLTDVNLSNDLRYIGWRAFSGNQLDMNALTLPSTLINIDFDAFLSNSGLFTLPTPTTDGIWASNGTSTSGEQVSSLSNYFEFRATDYTANDSDFIFENGEIIKYFGVGGNIAIPNQILNQDVIAIAVESFKGKASLTNITFPNSVEIIKQEAFYGHSRLSSITLPNQLKTVEKGAFQINSIQSITLPSSFRVNR